MGKYLGSTGLTNLWTKIKTYVDKHVKQSGNWMKISLNNAANVANILFSTAAVIIRSSGAILDVNPTYIQIKRQEGEAFSEIKVFNEKVELNGKVVFGSDDVNFKNEDTENYFFDAELVIPSDTGKLIKGMIIKKLYNIDENYMMASMEILSNVPINNFALVDTRNNKTVALFPPFNTEIIKVVNSVSCFSSMITMVLPKSVTNSFNSMRITKLN